MPTQRSQYRVAIPGTAGTADSKKSPPHQPAGTQAHVNARSAAAAGGASNVQDNIAAQCSRQICHRQPVRQCHRFRAYRCKFHCVPQPHSLPDCWQYGRITCATEGHECLRSKKHCGLHQRSFVARAKRAPDGSPVLIRILRRAPRFPRKPSHQQDFSSGARAAHSDWIAPRKRVRCEPAAQ